MVIRTAIVALTVVACGGGDSLSVDPLHAEVVDLIDIDPETELPRFELAERDLTSVVDVDQLAGATLSVTRGGVLHARQVVGSLIVDASFSDGAAPELRYAVDRGVLVPLDYPTLIMVSAYYQFERIVELSEDAGVPAAELVAAGGPFEILFEPEIRIDTGNLDVATRLKFNASYISRAHQFALAQRSGLETIPFAANRIVLAHEFGHALFEHAFEREGGDCDPEVSGDDTGELVFPGRLSSEYAIAGFDEGFGDFWAFSLTGATDVMAGDPLLAGHRSIARTTFTFDYTDDECGGGFYCIGTLFARALYRTFLARGLDPTDPAQRAAFAGEVIAAMKGTLSSLRARGELPEPDASATQCERREERDLDYDGRVAGAFLAALIENLPERSRAPLCAEAIAAFGDVGFPPELRTGCPEGAP